MKCSTQRMLTILLLFMGIQVRLLSQLYQARFEHITSDDGLSENVVNCIFQDSHGFMWFGTDDGLNRYDGYSFTIFKPTPGDEASINSNLIFALTEDAFGNLWVGTTGSGLNLYDPLSEKFRAFRYDPTDEESISHDHIISLLTDSKGRVWVGTHDGVNVIEPGNNRDSPYRVIRLPIELEEKPLTIYDIAEDLEGNMWLATRFGLFRGSYRGRGQDFKFKNIPIAARTNRPTRSLAFDQNGKLFVATVQGMYYRVNEGHSAKFIQVYEFPRALDFLVEQDHKIWSASQNGLLCFDKDEHKGLFRLEMTFTSEKDNPHSLNNNVIKCIYKDQTGIIWLGTDGGGVNKFDPSRKPFYHFGTSLFKRGNRYRKIRSFLEDSAGNSWVGTEGGGVFLQLNNAKAAPYDNLLSVGNSSSGFVMTEVNEFDEKVIYIGSEDAPFLQRVQLNTDGIGEIEEVADRDGSVFSILQDRHQNLWFGTYNQGFSRWIPRADGSYDKQIIRMDSLQQKGLQSNIIRKIFEDRKGNIWIGTANGLHLLPGGKTRDSEFVFQTFQNVKGDSTSLGHSYILDIFESTAGELWIGTFGGGLNRLLHGKEDTTITFRSYTEDHGLPNNSVKAIQEDENGHLWVASNRGLSRFDPAEETFLNFGTSDGLQASEFLEGASFKKANGELVFGGVNGFNVFYPDEIERNSIPPTVRFTKLLVHNREVLPGQKINDRVILTNSISNSESIVLKYRQNDFSIEFAALHYAAPRQNRFAYKLEGYHKDWVEVGADKRYSTFTNLPHGNYTLLVKAANGDDVWTEQPSRLDITIKPPFWFSWYAYFLYGAMIMGALWLYRRYTVISVREKHRLTLEHMEREKLEELNQMKLRFFTNISHELRTPLTLVIAPLERILEKGKTIPPERLQQHYHYMYKNAKYLLRLVNQLLDFRKLDQGNFNLRAGRGDIVNFLAETTEPFQFLANKKEIHFEVMSSEDRIYTFFDPDVIEKVIYNLLSNAFKFTPPNGSITIRVTEMDIPIRQIEGSYLEIRVKDDGPGISRKKVKKIFERFYKESSKKENNDGAGIGLAYTKSLVELHRGHIKVETIKGQGACFIVRLPMEKKAYLKSEIDQVHLERFETTSDPLEYLVAHPAMDLPPAAVNMGLEEREEKLPLLLFVDDNSDIRHFIREGFQNDFRIIEAEDGEKGLEIATASLPDIIVSDVMMPKMNGIEMCQTLKTNQLTSHIPIVLLTAKSTEEDELAGLKTGADAYVVKPFKLDILRTQLVNIYLQRERLKQRFRQEVILEPEDVTVTSADEEFLKKAMSIIEEHMSDSEFNVEALVREMYISRSKLYLKLRALTGQSSSEFIRTIRLKRAIQLLEKSNYTIKEIMYMTGFNTASYFSKCFKKQFGVVPSEYLRKQKKGTSIAPISIDE